MKFVIVFAALFALAVASPVDPKAAEILRYDNDNIGVGEYNYGVETSDGKVVSESGKLNYVGTEQEAIQVKGSFQYVGDDGKLYSVSYVADENGFQPVGDHLPVAPVV